MWNDIANLFFFFSSIINGFALPLKAEHKQFLVKVLIPLHTVRSLSLFHAQVGAYIKTFIYLYMYVCMYAWNLFIFIFETKSFFVAKADCEHTVS